PRRPEERLDRDRALRRDGAQPLRRRRARRGDRGRPHAGAPGELRRQLLLAASAHPPLRARRGRPGRGRSQGALGGRHGAALPRGQVAPARRAAPGGGPLAVSASARLAFVVALAGGGCASEPRLRSPDLTLEAERAGEGRAGGTALGLEADGGRLLVGDYGGRPHVLDVAEVLQRRFADPREERFEGGVLALGWSDARFMAVPRRGRGIESGEPLDRSADRWL